MLLTRNYSVVYAGKEDELPYNSIGHAAWDVARRKYTVGEGAFIWVWYGGKMLVRPAIDETGRHRTHSNLWGYDSIERYYRGRYDANTGYVSVTVPERMEFRELPESLIRDLHAKFPDITKIVPFR